MKQTTKFLHIVMCMVLGLSVSMTHCDVYGIGAVGVHDEL